MNKKSSTIKFIIIQNLNKNCVGIKLDENEYERNRGSEQDDTTREMEKESN